MAESLAELKAKVRTALATELTGAVGGAVRDVLAAALLDRVRTAPTCPPTPLSRTGEWREHGYEDRGRWDGPRDPWDDTDSHDIRDRAPVRYEHGETESAPPVPAAAALAVGVNVGRWWLGRHGSAPVAVGLGALAAVLGLAGGAGGAGRPRDPRRRDRPVDRRVRARPPTPARSARSSDGCGSGSRTTSR